MSRDDEFMRVIGAVARYNARRPRLAPEQEAERARAAHRADPRHQKALARRRKRKRGGPK